MNKPILYSLLVATILTITSCGKKREPSIVFMPDMYYPTAYDPYMEANFDYVDKHKESNVMLFKDQKNMTALWAPEGSVPRTESGVLPWDLKNTLDDYNKSKEITTSPLKPENREKDLERGQKMYEINCAVCHGVKGDGQGSIVQSGAYSGVPNYTEREISVGSVYHVIMYGKNAMGAYAPQLKPEDRWRVAEYVMEFKNQK